MGSERLRNVGTTGDRGGREGGKYEQLETGEGEREEGRRWRREEGRNN